MDKAREIEAQHDAERQVRKGGYTDAVQMACAAITKAGGKLAERMVSSLGTVDNKAASHVRTATTDNVFNRVMRISGPQVRHAYGQHGPDGKNLAQNQVPLTPDDFGKIVAVVNNGSVKASTNKGYPGWE
ncbi:MAG: hypothetical protein LBR38_05615 [Synergistaceae bacterium]|nr:hypothetical protein [Synergistaceae bacterium]